MGGLLDPRDVTVPAGVPSWRTPEMQHFCMGLDAMMSDVERVWIV
jgi:hypothetical protein